MDMLLLWAVWWGDGGVGGRVGGRAEDVLRFLWGGEGGWLVEVRELGGLEWREEVWREEVLGVVLGVECYIMVLLREKGWKLGTRKR